MKFLRTILTDLRERQILPAVVLLAVLAVAIPVVASATLDKVTPPPPPPAVQPTIAPPKGVTSPVHELTVLNATPPSTQKRGGTEPNPFVQQAGVSGGSGSATTPTTPTVTTPTVTTPKTTTTPKKTTTTPKKTSTTPKTTTTKTSTTPKTTTTTTSTTTSKTTTKPATATPNVGPATLKSTQAYSTSIDTKDAQGTHVLSNVVRLAPLPQAQSPEVIFLGVLKGGQKDVFLFTNPVQVSASSNIGKACLPSAADCQLIELSPGQGMKLAPTSNSALIATFTFQVASIGVKNFSSSSAASAARAAVSSAGQTLLPLSGSPELASFHFDGGIGALVFHATPTGATGATGSTSATGGSGTTELPPASGTSLHAPLGNLPGAPFVLSALR